MAFSGLLIAAFSAAVVEAAVGADGEISAGRAPIEIDGPEQDSIVFTLVPGAALRLTSPTSSLAASYTPRLFYRYPNALDVSRPLVLHQFALAHSAESSPRVSWASSAQLSVGQLDYTAASVVFTPGRVVRTRVTEVLRADGTTGVELSLTHRTSLSLEFAGEYTTSLDEPVPPSVDAMATDDDAPLDQLGDTLPSSAGASFQSSLSHSITRSDQVGLTGLVAYQWFADTGRYLLLSPELSYNRKLGSRGTFGVSGGLAYVLTLEAPRQGSDANTIGGTGGLQIGSLLYSASGASVSASLSASVEWFFDPIAGTSQPRAGVELGTDITIGRHWQIGPNASFFALLDVSGVDAGGDPLPDAQISPDATLLRAEIPFRYALSPTSSFNFGGRAALRGPALASDSFRLTEQVELWAYVGLTIRMSSGSGDVSWLPL